MRNYFDIVKEQRILAICYGLHDNKHFLYTMLLIKDFLREISVCQSTSLSLTGYFVEVRQNTLRGQLQETFLSTKDVGSYPQLPF